MASTKDRELDSNPLSQGIEGTTAWDTATLTYYFATDSDRASFEADSGNHDIFKGKPFFDALDSTNAVEAGIRNDITTAMAAWSRVASIPVFVESANYSTADIKIAGVGGLEPDPVDGSTTTGAIDLPGGNPMGPADTSPDDYELYMVVNTSTSIVTDRPDDDPSDEKGAGYYGLHNALHELGHGLGLDHPHEGDNGSKIISDEKVKGDAAYDNERYTIMSYETGGLNISAGGSYGHAVTPMALDIFALQNMYGAKSSFEGNNTYKLTDAGTAALDTDGSDGTISIGRAFYAIWDTGGTDEITYAGSNRAVLNLNNASMSLERDERTEVLVDLVGRSNQFKALPDKIKYNLTDPEYNAAGNFSSVFDSAGDVQLGGFSIASDAHDSGAKIENASGGDGDDILVGNEISNTLKGNAGNDLLLGSAGADNLEGGEGNDELGGGEGNDALKGGPGDDTALFSDVCENYELERNDKTGVITVSHVSGTRIDGVDTLKDIEQASFRDGKIDLTADEFGCPSIDFIFLVDLSGSFSDDLPNFVAAAPGIFDAVRAIDPEAQFAISSFVDLPESPFGEPGDYVYRPELALTSSLSEFQSALDGLTIKSGADGPESQWAGLWGAANGVGLALREDSRKVILIATDAPAHSASDYGLDETTVRQFLIDNAIDVRGGSTAGASIPGTAGGPESTGGEHLAGPTRRGSGESSVNPTDVGDTDPKYVGAVDDPLVREVFSTFVGSTTVLLAVTPGAEEFYEEEVPKQVASAIAPLARSGEDIADAVRLALASVTGEVTEKGGNASDDLLVGTSADDGLFGLGGNDTILGRAGNDVVDGGSGDDRLNGGEGDDDIRGGTGNDLIFDGMGDDRIDGGDGEDRIYVFSGTNEVRGGLGNDHVSGGVGEDTLHGGAGDDVLKGGGDSDTFVYGPGDGVDVIEDFSGAEDRIDLRGFAGISGLSDLTITTDGDGTTVSLDPDGGADIRLEGFVGSLDAKHFLFAEPIAPADDFSADESTTGTVGVDSSATGSIETEGDRDWFAVELVAGHTYVVDLEGSETGRGTLDDPHLRGIYDADGNLVPDTSNDDFNGSRNSRVTYTPAADGSYYVAVGASESGEGTYTVSVRDTGSVSEAAGEDLPADTTTTGRVGVDSSATGTVGTVGDEDWFAVELVAGRTYAIDLEGSGTGLGRLADPYLRGIHDADGNLLSGTSNDDVGDSRNSRVTYTPTVDGTYYVAAGAFGLAEGTYTVSVRETASVSETGGEDLPTDTTTAGRVEVDSSAIGTIGTAGDEDWFAVELVAGRTYAVDLESSGTGLGRLADPYLRGIHDADGNLLSGTSNDDFGLSHNSRVTYTPTVDGTYYVAVGAYETDEGTYKVSVTETETGSVSETGGADLPTDATTAGRIEVDSSAIGTVGTEGDEDWFAVELYAGVTYEVDLEGSETGHGTLADPYLRGIHDAGGNLIADTSNDDDGLSRNSRVTYTPTVDGTYYVAVGAYETDEGTYKVSVTETYAIAEPTGGELPTDTTTTGTVTVDGPAIGTVATGGDQDWLAVEMAVGPTHWLRLERSDIPRETFDDPHLRAMLDADGDFM